MYVIPAIIPMIGSMYVNASVQVSIMRSIISEFAIFLPLILV